MSARAPRPQSSSVFYYLLGYNILAALGWLYIDALVARHFLAHGALGAPAALYAAAQAPLKAVQTAALLEVAHAALGLVRGDAFVAFVQVFARLAVLWGFVHVCAAAQASPAFSVMLASWALVEVPRYAFYALNLVDARAATRARARALKEEGGAGDAAAAEAAAECAAAAAPRVLPRWLLWLRYSLFIVLYPPGIAGEIGCILASLETLRSRGAELGVSVQMPNAWNVRYDHYAVALFLLTLYVPGSPYMVMNMWRSRVKALGKVDAAAPRERRGQRRERGLDARELRPAAP